MLIMICAVVPIVIMSAIKRTDYIKMLSIAYNTKYLKMLTDNAEGSWVLRISSMDKYVKYGKCKLYGLENASIASILTISVNKQDSVINYRILCMLDLVTRTLLYAIPAMKYNTINDKVDGISFKVRDLGILSMELNPQPNMVYNNFDEIISDRLKLSQSKELIFDDICSTKILQTVSTIYSV